MKKGNICVLIGCMLLLMATAALAATIVWSGEGANSNWSTSGNWVGGTVPTSTDDVKVLDTTPQSTSTVNDFIGGGPEEVSSMLLGNSMTLNVDETFTVTDIIQVQGSVTVNGDKPLIGNKLRIINGSLAYSGSAQVQVSE